MSGGLIAKVRSCLPSGARQFSTKLGALIGVFMFEAVYISRGMDVVMYCCAVLAALGFARAPARSRSSRPTCTIRIHCI